MTGSFHHRRLSILLSRFGTPILCLEHTEPAARGYRASHAIRSRRPHQWRGTRSQVVKVPASGRSEAAPPRVASRVVSPDRLDARLTTPWFARQAIRLGRSVPRPGRNRAHMHARADVTRTRTHTRTHTRALAHARAHHHTMSIELL